MATSLIKENWTEIWRSTRKRIRLISGTLIMLGLVFILPFFFSHIEKRKGAPLNDWMLAHIQPHNVSVLIFAIIWGMIVFIMIRAIYHPTIYIKYCWTLIFVCVARFISISLVPLAPPVGLIPLTDPLTGIFYGNASITKDLFFSGHTATLTLIFLCLERRTDKIIAFIAVIVVAFLLLVQHIHYTIDILAAPIVVYVLYSATNALLYKNVKQKEAVIAREFFSDKLSNS